MRSVQSHRPKTDYGMEKKAFQPMTSLHPSKFAGKVMVYHLPKEQTDKGRFRREPC